MKKDLKMNVVLVEVLLILFAVGLGIIIGNLIARVGNMEYYSDYLQFEAIARNDMMLRESPYGVGGVKKLHTGQKMSLTGYAYTSQKIWVQVISDDTLGWVSIEGLDLQLKKASG